MNHWDVLVRTALVGTERQQPSISAAGDDVGELLAQIDLTQPERAVLQGAALLAPWRRAGIQASVANSSPSVPAPPEQQCRCSAEAAQYVALLVLQRLYPDLLPELLKELTANQFRIPEEYLPELLAIGAARSELQPLILPVLGERGRWLATQYHPWSYACRETDASVWQTGTRAERKAFFEALRAANPVQARELLQTTWAEEDPKDRAVFVGLLAIGLSADDEPLLEAALDDRRKEVRSTAADLLARIPTSRLVQRMIERVRPLLTFVPEQKRQLLGLLRGDGARLDIALPATCNPAMQRDGIELKSPRSELGDKAWWLLQMLAAIPPGTWSTLWQATPSTLIETTSRSEWQVALLEGWAWACERHRNVAWAEALVGATPAPVSKDFEPRIWQGRLLHILRGPQLIDVLAPEQREALLAALLQSRREEQRARAWALLPHCRHQWSAAFSRAILNQLRQIGTSSKGQQHVFAHRNLPIYATCVAPALLHEAILNWPDNPEPSSSWDESLGEMLTLLEFRHNMLTTINGG